MIQKMRKGHETNWFVIDRIQIMVKEKFVKLENDTLALLPKGVFVGKMRLVMNKFLNMGTGG